MPDIFKNKSSYLKVDDKKIIISSVKVALRELVLHREKEGKTIEKDILAKVKLINNDIKKIVRLSNANIQKEFKKIKEKINIIIPKYNLDKARLYQEVAFILEKKDINEELSRFEGHMNLLIQYLEESDSAGKKINFLLQELNREINTIGSKIDKIKIKHTSVEIKNNIEKIREQVQNIL